MTIVSTNYEERLAHRVLDCDQRPVEAALALFERHQPATLPDAARLIEAHGPLTTDAFEHLAQAYDIYWHLRDMPCD